MNPPRVFSATSRVVSAGTAIAILYVGWIVMSPHVRFPELVDLRIERLLMAIGWIVALLFVRRERSAISAVSLGILFFFLAMSVSHSASPYPNNYEVVWWGEEYWKRVVFFFLLTFLIPNKVELHRLIVWSGVVLFLYVGYSLFDFAKGGSYVWQQGIRRAVGVWSGGGIGAANEFGFLGLFAIPFGVYIWLQAKKRWEYMLALATLGVAVLAILLSGTRAAVVCGLLLAAVALRGKYAQVKYGFGILAILALIWVNLPIDVQNRYLSILPSVNTEQVAGDVAASSAQSRIEGFKDGYRLFRKRPILGYGPGSSPYARLEVSEYAKFDPADPSYLQLHNLYGQVIGEGGILAALAFGLLLFLAWSAAKKARSVATSHDGNDLDMASMGEFLTLALIGIFSYGMFSHNLYSYEWLYLFAIASIMRRLVLTLDLRTAKV